MKIKRLLFATLSGIGILFSHTLHPLGGYRRRAAQNLPRATAQWEGDTKKYTITSSHLEAYPIFAFRKEFFQRSLLPDGPIPGRNDPHTVVATSQQLTELIEGLLQELRQRTRKFSHFTVLQSKDFNFSRSCGLLVLKFNDYPFVLKLFIEYPETFFDRYAKGTYPTFFFYMAGGANRHIGGLTRIDNRQRTLNKVADLPDWAGRIDIPRKWFWESKNNRWISLHGYHLGTKRPLVTSIPGTYAVIADEIDTHHQYPISHSERTTTVMQLSNDLDLFIDAHESNFVFTHELVNGKPKIIIIDTEHFPSIVGIKHKRNFSSYPEWYTFLAQKCFHDCYLRTKQIRLASLNEPHELKLW